jgi:hypothetical protein
MTLGFIQNEVWHTSQIYFSPASSRIARERRASTVSERIVAATAAEASPRSTANCRGGLRHFSFHAVGIVCFKQKKFPPLFVLTLSSKQPDSHCARRINSFS